MLELIAVTSYSLPSSPERYAKAVGSEDESALENEIRSPTLNAYPEESASSTATTVSPADSAAAVKLFEPKCCSYTVAEGHTWIPIELPQVPADLAYQSFEVT